MKFFDWAYKNGDSIAQQLEYIPLPAAGEGRGPQPPGSAEVKGRRQAGL